MVLRAKIYYMATLNKKSGNNKKKQTVDTSRTSNQRRKLPLGGSKETDNKGRPTRIFFGLKKIKQLKEPEETCRIVVL